MIKELICVIFICFFVKQSYSQPYYFKHYQVENGLSNNAVICSLQDSKGFMWFGTRDGLNRFDGYTFKVFRHDTNDSLSIGHNYIHSLFEDKQGKIWAGTDFGIFIYDPITESFTHFQHDREAVVVNIQSDQDGNIWYIANFSSLIQYRPQTNVYKEFTNLKVSSIDAMVLSKAGVWIGSGTGEIKFLNPISGDIKSYDIFKNSPPLRTKSVICLTWDEQFNRLWIGTSKQGAKVLYPKENRYEDLVTLSDDGQPLFVRDIKKIGSNQYWFATESGVFIYLEEKKKILQLRKQDNNPWTLSDNANYTLCKDREGGIWVGSWFGGLSYYHRQHTFFEKYFPLNENNSLSGSAVREIVEDDAGNLWVGTENGGLNKFSSNQKKIEHFTASGRLGDLSGSNIHGLLVTGDTLWVGTFHQGLNLMSIATGKVFKQYYAGNGKHSLKSNFIYTMLRLRTGKVLLATDHGIYQYLSEEKAFKKVEGFPEYIFYTSLYEDSDGTIWAGTWRDGLYFYNPNTNKKGLYTHMEGNDKSLASNRITNIKESRNKELWVGTEEGLCYLNKEKDNFIRYNFQRSSEGILVCAILEDEQESLWVSTSKGLIQFNPKSGFTRSFSMANGLLSNQFNYNAAYKAKDGILYFGSVKGLIRFDPGGLKEKNFVPPVYITGFQVYDRDLEINGQGSPLKKSITFTDTILLKYNQSSFSIDFAALSYVSPNMTEYSYKMEGLDPNWTYLQTNRKAYFTELSPGKYTFKVSAVNSEGKRIGKGAVLFIHILPPFWASGAAYVLYFILLVCLIYYIINTYHQRVKEKNRIKLEQLAHRKEEETYRAKIDFFTQVAHEIRTPLTLIKGPMEKIIKQVDEVPAIRKNLLIMEKNTDRLLQLSGQLLDFRKTEEKGFRLNYQKINITQFLKEQIERIKPTTQEKKIKVKAEFSKEPIWAFVDVDALDKIVSNLLNNGLKYAASKIYVDLELKDSSFHIAVASDGNLIPIDLRDKIFEPFYRLQGSERHLGTGLGLALAKSLAEMHGGHLILDTENMQNFNTFVLSLPVNQ
ncbi:ligand-binding sensor domain-containing protein [Olivibacter domesticus]|uniref:histidine kinase n=1 Tax=Olivibacter domesticus TaxID=407022 RepID=A0A1H7T5U5_OLID1|nr:sensor histidine kinase [Olivibacter domesticus]SEL79869.1 Two component regulator propeller [Olivibacter domesticus]